MRDKLIVAAALCVFLLSGCVLVDSGIENNGSLSTSKVRVWDKTEMVYPCEIVWLGGDNYQVYNPLAGNSKGC